MPKAKGQHVEIEETPEVVEETKPEIVVVAVEDTPMPKPLEKVIVTLYGDPTQATVFNGVEVYTADLKQGSIVFTDDRGREFVHSGSFTIQKVRSK